MDITSEATVDAFTIGPSTLVGRAIALRILLCGSLRRHLALFLRAAVLRLRAARGTLSTFVAWFHPRDARGILAAAVLLAFALRRFAGARSRAESAYRRRFWRNVMRAALTYEEWSHAAKMLEKETAAGGSKESDLYDEELVRNKLQELRRRRQEGSLRDIVFCMRADLLRNLGNMCNPELHRGRLQVNIFVSLSSICPFQVADLSDSTSE